VGEAVSEFHDIAQEFHQAYVAATGLKVKYTMEYYSDYYLFAKDYSADDIPVVVNYLRKLYRDKPEILAASLRITKLIREKARFGEFLAEALADARKPKENPAAAAKQAWRGLPEEDTRDTSKPVGQILPHVQRGLEKLKKFKEEQGWT
jgi:hypothetical protein